TPTRTHKENAHHDYPHHHLRRRPPRGRYEHRLGHPQGHVPHPHRRHPHHRRGGGRRVVRLGPVRHRGAPRPRRLPRRGPRRHRHRAEHRGASHDPRRHRRRFGPRRVVRRGDRGGPLVRHPHRRLRAPRSRRP